MLLRPLLRKSEYISLTTTFKQNLCQNYFSVSLQTLSSLQLTAELYNPDVCMIQSDYKIQSLSTKHYYYYFIILTGGRYQYPQGHFRNAET